MTTNPVVFFLLGDSPASEFYVQTFSCSKPVSVKVPLAISSHLSFLFTRPTKMEKTECSETSAHKIQTPGSHPKEKKYNIHNTANA